MSNIPSVSIWCPRAYQTHLGTICDVFKGKLDLEGHVHEGKDCAAIEAALTATADRPVVILYESLADALNRALGHLGSDETSAIAGENRPRIVVALEEWIAGNTALTALFFRHRQRITLLPALALLHAPDSLHDLLAARFGGGDVLKRSSTAEPDDQLLPPGVDPKFALMASAILKTAPEAQNARDQIEAISTPLQGFDLQLMGTPRILEELPSETKSASEPDFGICDRDQHDNTVLDLRRLQARHEQDMAPLRRQSDAAQIRLLDAVAQQNQLSDLAEQNKAEAAALRDLHHRDVEAVRDALTAQLEEGRTALADATRRHDEIRSALETARTEASDLARERDALTAQLNTERAAFGTLAKRNDDTRAALERQIARQVTDIAVLARDMQDRDRAAVDAQNLYDAIVRSSSWRITRPIRVIVRALRWILRR